MNDHTVTEILRGIQDPELGFSIVGLGLVYKVTVDEASKRVTVLMTMTSPACPLQDYFVKTITTKIQAQYPEWGVDVTITFEPRWSTEKISQEIKEQLALLGLPIH